MKCESCFQTDIRVQGPFPADMALLKLIYRPAMSNAKKWTMQHLPIRTWLIGSYRSSSIGPLKTSA